MAEEKKPKFDKSAWDQAYMKENVKRVLISLNKVYDKDIIEHLDTKPNKSGYIKSLIRKDIDRGDQTDQDE